MTPAATADPDALAEALAALRSAGSHPIVRCFPQGAIIVFDGDLRYLCAGGLGLSEVGLSREMLEGNTIGEVFPPEVVAVIEPLYRRALAGEESSIDVPYEGRIYLQRLGPLRAADGTIVAGMGFTQDVTTARRHERELVEAGLRFRLAFEHAPIAKALIGLDGRYQLVNPAMCAFTGYSEHELLGLTMADITHPDDLAADLDAMAAAQTGDLDSYTMDKRYRTASGATVWGAKSATLVRGENGIPLHFISQTLDITARKQSEQALLDERRRLGDAESIGRVGSWERDLDTDAIYWSAGMFEMWGIDREGFDGGYVSAREQIHPDDRPALDAAVDACATTGAPFRLRYRIARASDNSPRWIEARGAAFRESGRIVRIGGALADITDQVAADAAAAAAAAFQEAVFNASPDIIAVWDFASASITWANHSITELLGYREQDVAGMGDLKGRLVYAPDLDHFDAVMSAARNAVTDEVISIDYRMVGKDGSLKWFSRRTAPIARDERGLVTQIVGVIRDITDAKAAEAALQESETRFRQLAENVNVGFVLRSLDPPAVLYVSPGYENIIGYNPMTAGNDPLTALRSVIHPDDWEQVQTQYWAKVGAGLPAEGEFRVLRPDGAVRWVHATSSPVVDPDGVVRRTASTGEDITDRKLAEAARLSAENSARAAELKSEFLSRASHELRTPLNAVLGFGQLLELANLTDDQQDAVQQILQGGRNLMALVDDILDITNIHSERFDLAIESVDADELLAECVQQMTPLATAQHVTVDYQPGAAALVRADPRRLSQVVNNLLSNAITFNRPGGRVDITYQTTDLPRNLDIVVADTGLGIATQDLPRLFLPFDRIGTQTNHAKGTGLGLTLSRDLMTAMGGTLQVTSQEGVGSIFTASIPLASADGDQEPSTPAATTTSTSGAPKTVLYIEDNPTNVGLLEQIVAYRPHITLKVAMLGRHGLEMALDDPPDLILLDLHLPDISGQQVLQRLRADPRTATTPIVILSADATRDQPQRLIAMGATSYQTKPVKVPRILDLFDGLDNPLPQPATIPSQSKPINGPHSLVVVDDQQSNRDGVAATLSTFRHDMVNLLGVILTYCDLLTGDETKPAKITWLEKQGTATEQAIELTQQLQIPRPT